MEKNMDINDLAKQVMEHPRVQFKKGTRGISRLLSEMEIIATIDLLNEIRQLRQEIRAGIQNMLIKM